MRNVSRSGRNVGTFRSKFVSLAGVGVTSMLLVAGMTIFGVSPAGASSTVTFGTVPSSGTAGVALSPAVVVDVSGGTSADGDTITITSPNCVYSHTGNTASLSSGVATFAALVLDTAGSCNLVATDTTAGGTSLQSSAITIAAGTASQIAFTTEPQSKAVINIPLTFKVSVEDAEGNVVPANTDSIGIVASGGCTIGGTATESAVTGVATFSTVYFLTGSSCTLTANDVTEGGFATVESTSIAVTADTPGELAFTTEPSAPAAAGAALTSFAVSVESSSGVVLSTGTGATDVINLTSSTCKIGGVDVATATAGIATFSAAYFTTTGSCSFIATDSTRTLATVTSLLITVSPGTPTKVIYTTAPPASVTTTGTALTTFAVSVEDTYGNVDTTGTGATDVVTITSPCTLGGTASATAVAGVATFAALTITETGSCVLTATDTTRTLTTSTATIVVGETQTTLVISTTLGYRDTPLTLATTGGSGTGAVTYTVVNGTATGCTITGDALSATSAGTCIVTASKAAASPYAPAVSAATTVTISSAPKAVRVIGTISNKATATVTITGYNFFGRPTIISNVAGFSVKVTHDTGKTLTVVVKVTAVSKVGVHVMTLTFANGDKTSVKYSLHS